MFCPVNADIKTKIQMYPIMREYDWSQDLLTYKYSRENIKKLLVLEFAPDYIMNNPDEYHTMSNELKALNVPYLHLPIPVNGNYLQINFTPLNLDFDKKNIHQFRKLKILKADSTGMFYIWTFDGVPQGTIERVIELRNYITHNREESIEWLFSVERKTYPSISNPYIIKDDD